MRRRSLCPAFLAPLVCLAVSVAALAQESSTELWPETDIWLRLSPAWRLSMYLPFSKNVETNYREGSVVLQADYAFGTMKHPAKRRLLDESRAREMKRFLLRGGYLGGKSLGDEGQAYKEKTVLFELHVRTPLKGRILLSHRL